MSEPQIIVIDLNREPDIKDLTSTMQPGDPVRLNTTIKSMDDQSLALRISSAEEGESDTEDANESGEESTPGKAMAGSGETQDESPMGGTDVTGQ